MSITVVDSLFNALDMCSTPPKAHNIFPNDNWKEAINLEPAQKALFDSIRDKMASTTV